MALLEKVATRRRLRLAWNAIRHRSESKGLDGQTIEDFQQNLNQNLDFIRKELLAGTYTFIDLRGFPLKQENKIRPLKIPAVRDRVVQKAIEMVISPLLKKRYPIDNPCSYAYIKNRSVKDAAEKVRAHFRDGCGWVYEADIVKFFNKVDREKLLNDFIFCALPDRSINNLIASAINAEIGNGDELARLGVLNEFPSGSEGIPQGGILSPLFANIYLSPLDSAMIEKKFRLVRYADDFIVMCKTEQEARNADILARKIVEDQLKLTIYPFEPVVKGGKCSSICRFHNVEFLGLRFQGTKIMPGPKAMKKIIQTIKNIPIEYRSANLSRALYSIRSKVLTWGATYYYTDIPEEFERSVNEHLTISVKKLLRHFGLAPTVKRFDTIHLVKLGIPGFTSAIQRMRTQKESSDK